MCNPKTFLLSFLTIFFQCITAYDVFAQIDTGLMKALKENNLNAVQNVIQKNIDINAKDSIGGTVLMWAVYYADLEIAKYLVNKGADFNRKGVIELDSVTFYGNLLGIAAAEGKIEHLKYFIENCKIDVDDKEYDIISKKNDGWTALQWAAEKNRKSIVGYLLGIGANKEIAVNELSKFYYRTGQYNLALLFAKKALKKIEKEQGVMHPVYGLRLNDIGVYYQKLGEYRKAESFFIKAIEVIDSSVGREDDQLWYASLNGNLAWFYFEIGEYEKARQLYLEVLQITQRVKGKYDYRYGVYLNNYAILLESLGEYETALNTKLEALNITRETEGSKSKSYAIRLMNLASLYSDLGQYNKSLSFLLEAKQILKETVGDKHDLYGGVINNLAQEYYDLREYEKALEGFLEAKNILKRTVGEKNFDYAIMLNNIGDCYRQKRRPEYALEFYLQALQIIEESKSKLDDHYIGILNNIGLTYHFMKEHQSALIHFEKAIKYAKQNLGKAHPKYGVGALNLATLHENMGQIEQAEELYKEVTQNYLFQLKNYYPFQGGNKRLKFLSKIEKNIQRIFSFSIRHKNRIPEVNLEVLKINALIKGLSLEGSIATQLYPRLDLDSLKKETYYKWTIIKKKISRSYLLSIAQRNNLKLNLDSLLNVADSLEGILSKVSNSYDFDLALNYNNHLNSKLSNDEVIIDFFHFRYHNGRVYTDSIIYCATIIQPNSDFPKIIPLVTQKTLRPFLQKTISHNSNNYITNKQIGIDLYKLIWKPLLPHLKNAKTIYIGASGMLHRLAFGALPTFTKDSYLVNKYDIRYYSTLRDFKKERFEQHNPKNVLLVGGAQFEMDSLELYSLSTTLKGIKDKHLNYKSEEFSRSIFSDSTRSTVHFPFLPGTLEEVSAINLMFRKKSWKTNVYTGKLALEDNVKKHSFHDAPRIIHLATHGYFFAPLNIDTVFDKSVRERVLSSKEPLVRNGLVFSGVNYIWRGGQPIDGLDDGVLTAYEISNLDLSNTNLAVLSACNSGLGDINNVEGVLGLQRAFKIAGVDNLIISLWKVPDKSTSEFMQLFYKYYLKGKSLKTAFNKAQGKMRKRYPPYYWAAFVLIE